MSAAHPIVHTRYVPRRIALTVSGTDAGRSGLGTWVEAVVPRLIELVKARGGEVFVAGSRSELATYQHALAGARLTQLPSWAESAAGNALWHLSCMAGWARARSAEVVLLPAANRRLCTGGKTPVVAVVHDLSELHRARDYHPLRNVYVERVVIPALRRCEKVIAVSEATRRDLIEKAGVSRGSVAVVSNGVDLDHFGGPVSSRARARMRDRHELDGPYLLYPARLEAPGKNHLRLIRAFAKTEVRATHKLIFCGADWGAAPEILAEIAALGLTDQVRWLGRVPSEDLVALYAECAAVVMAGLHEGFGLPAAEALAAGKPVAGSCTGALPEVIGRYGTLFDPLDELSIAEAIDRVTLGSLHAPRASRSGRAHVARFSWDDAATHILRVCGEAVDTNLMARTAA